MGSLAMLLATPIFGLSLHVHAAALDLPHAAPSLQVNVAAAFDGEANASFGEESEAEIDEQSADAASSSGEDEYVEQMRTRESLAGIHRILGISTWVLMAGAVTTGFIQYYNLYGIFADQASNPCVEGSAIFGQGQCSGTPLPHALLAGGATLTYIGTFSLALLMPDPDNLSDGPGEFASTLRMHKLLRWVHFGGMVLQAILGPIIANASTFGLNRADDYGTLQALSTIHMASGVVTFGALTWAGALMIF